MFQNLKMNMDIKVMQARKAVGEIQAMPILAKNLHEEEEWNCWEKLSESQREVQFKMNRAYCQG